MEELLSLKWNNHKSTFIHVLSILRDKQLYTDATIACEGKFYSVHKLVLSTCSDYFSAMLDRTNCKSPVIVLKDIKSEDLEALLDYMYLGEVNVRQSDLATLIKAAECLRVKGLAVPDDEPPPPRKTKASENLSRKRDSSRSPPSKRKRHSDVDDIKPSRPQDIDASPVHKPKSPVVPMSSQSSVQSKNSSLRPSTTNKILTPDQSSLNLDKSTTNTAINSSEHNKQEHDITNQSDCFVKVEMDDFSNAPVETFDISNEDGFKEEGCDDGATSGGGGGESGGDLSNDLPEFLQHASSDPGAFGHSSFGGSSFQPNELADWHRDGSNTGYSQVNFNLAEGSSQQNAPGVSQSPDTLLSACLPTNTNALGGPPVLLQVMPPQGGRRRACHTDAELECSFCGKQFYKSDHLRAHTRTHTGERPYLCRLCPYRAARNGTLKRHMINIHAAFE